MGLLGTSYTNRSMGIDLLQDKNRSCMYFENDNQLGCINENFLYVRDLIVNKDFLYDLKSKTAVSQDNKEVKMLKQYAVSMMTVAEHLIKNGGTREDKD
jgi:hypothetical protein